MEGHIDLMTGNLIILNVVSFSFLVAVLWHYRKRQKQK